MNDESYFSERESMELFFSEEIRNSSQTAQFYLKWLLDNSSYHSMSGNAFFLEKKDGEIVIGNLFDETFLEAKVLKQRLIDFIHSKFDNL